jgi:hypothetical protein
MWDAFRTLAKDAFLIVFDAGFCSFVGAYILFASCTANRALNLLRASSLEFNTSFFLDAGGFLTEYYAPRIGPNGVPLGPVRCGGMQRGAERV